MISTTCSDLPAVAGGTPGLVTARCSGVDRVRRSTALTWVAVLQEEFHRRGAAKPDGAMEGCDAIFIGLVDIGAMTQKQTNHRFLGGEDRDRVPRPQRAADRPR